MAKTNPFIKGLSPAELAKLRRKAPYVDQVYNPETNEVNYDIILRRLNDTTKKVSDVEQIFLNQVKRNLQREYWRQAVDNEHMINGEWANHKWYTNNRGDKFASADPERLRKQRDYLQSLYKKDTVSDYNAAFDNIPGGNLTNLKIKPYSLDVTFKINQFMPEDLKRYDGREYGYSTVPGDNLLHGEPVPYYLPDYSKRDLRAIGYLNDGQLVQDKSPRRQGMVKVPLYASNKAQSFNLDPDAPKKNMHTLETYFNRINEGIGKVNKAYANRKEQERIEKENALNRAIKAEAAVASYQSKEKFDREQFDRALADKDKAYNERFEQANAEFKKLIDARDTAYKAETAKRAEEFDNWRKTFESSSIEQAKQQAEQHTREMSQLRAESVRQAQDLANAKVENERIKSQNAILLKNNTRRRMALKQMGNIGLNFIGAGQRDSQSTALLNVLAGKNRYVPATRRVNEYGRLVESRGDTAVPDTFLSLISPQPQNRRK